MQLLAHVSGFVSQIVAPQKHIGGTSRFCFSIFSRRFLFKASKKLTQHSLVQADINHKIQKLPIFWRQLTATISVLMAILR